MKLINLSFQLLFVILFSLNFSSNFILPTRAIQLRDGTVVFAKSPRLIKAITTFNEVRIWGAKYYFTIELPENAGAALEKITINQREGYENIQFNLSESLAFMGEANNKQEKIAIKSVLLDKETKTISVIFSSPIQPGTIFTLGLIPQRNPDFSGIYLFGVTAFPAGEKSQGLYLGVGRFHFERGDNIFRY